MPIIDVGRCGIYEKRPDFCHKYPRRGDYIPEGCTFTFDSEGRQGECRPDLCGDDICCAKPRTDGDPEKPGIPEGLGGFPCKHLTWIKVEVPDDHPSQESLEKKASIAAEVFEEGIRDILGDEE
jgi:hypothetical protein